MESDIWIPYRPYGVQVLAIGYHASVDSARRWQIENGLTHPVLSDFNGDVTLTYTNWFGFPYLPWDAVVSEEWLVAYTGDTYAGGAWNVNEIIAVFDSLFSPEIAADTTLLDFGLVPIGQSAERELILRNAGTGLLEVQNISATPATFSVDVTQGQIYAVDDSLVVTVTFTPSDTIAVNGVLTVQTSAGDLQVQLFGDSPNPVARETALPTEFAVHCYPNPFNPELTVELSLEKAQETMVEVFTLDGARRAVLHRGWMPAGTHRFRWQDEEAPSGMYLIQVAGGDWSEIRKVFLVR